MTAGSRWARSAQAFRRSAPRVAAEILVNVAAPVAIYTLATSRVGNVQALMAAATPPIAWSILEFVRRRRIDALSLLVLLGIVLSVLAFFGGGGVKILQMREHLVIAVIGLVFLGSAAIGRPLIYQLARARIRRVAASELDGFEALRDSPIFRQAMLVMTLVWGVGLIAEASVACVLVFTLSTPQYLVASPILGFGAMGGFTAWTFWYARRRVLAARHAMGAA